MEPPEREGFFIEFRRKGVGRHLLRFWLSHLFHYSCGGWRCRVPRRRILNLDRRGAEVEAAGIGRAPTADCIPASAASKKSPPLNAIFTAPPRYESCVFDESCREYAEQRLNAQVKNDRPSNFSSGEYRANCRRVQVPLSLRRRTQLAIFILGRLKLRDSSTLGRRK